MDNRVDELLLSIKKLLHQRIGIDLDTLSGLDLPKILEKKIQSLTTANLEQYYFQLLNNQATLDELSEEVVIPETSFFRHPASFEHLKAYVLSNKAFKSHLRILSIPCSTGEEPYSIALTLLECGLTPSQITIDAFDLSHNAIVKAQWGQYRQYAFRSIQQQFEEYYCPKYFTVEQNIYSINPEVKALINFRQGNLVDPAFLGDGSTYDVIFCRNVLIYFGETARKLVLMKLHQLLVNEGLLFIGYAETNFINKNYFTSLSVPHAFVYQKQQYLSFLNRKSEPSPIINPNPPSHGSGRAMPSPRLPKPVTNKFKPSVAKKTPIKTKPSPPTPPRLKEVQPQAIEAIRLMADRGNLDLAMEQCQLFLQGNPTNAQAHLLLGEIYQAKNLDGEAQQSFKKSLYLNPNCVESLTHLIFLCEQAKDFQQAQRYRDRLQQKQG